MAADNFISQKGIKPDMTVIETILTVNAQLTSVLSIVPNILVIFLACTTRVHEIRQYRWIIAAQSALEIAISMALALLNLTLYNGHNSLLMFVCGNGVRHSIPLSVTIFSIYCVMLILGIFTHPLAFLYRYAYICSKEKLKSLFTLRGTIMVTSFFITFSCLFAYGLWQRTTIAVYDAISYAGVEGTTVVISVEYEQFQTASGMLIDVACTVLFLLTILAAYITVFYCTNKIFRKLRISHMHAKTRAVQRQLNFVMLLQASFPILFTTLPIMIFFVCIATDWQIGEGASLIIILLNWQPCAHPFISLHFVAPFRRRILRALSCKPTTLHRRIFSISHTSHHVPTTVINVASRNVIRNQRRQSLR